MLGTKFYLGATEIKKVYLGSTLVHDTTASDTTPDAFAFGDYVNQALSTQVLSNSVTITGIDAVATATIDQNGTDAEFQVHTSGLVLKRGWGTAPASIDSGDLIQLRMTTAATNLAEQSATMTVGGVSDEWSVTTTDVILEDDFSSGTLDPAWTATVPAGGTITSGVTVDTETALAMFVPDGDFDIHHTIDGATLLQPVDDADWRIEAEFLTAPTVAFNGYGLMIKADAANWAYFRFAKFETEHLLQVMDTVAGVSSRPADIATLPADAAHLRVTRSGDTFIFERSADGVTWIQHYSYTRAFTPTEIGVAAHNTNHNPGDWTAHVNQVVIKAVA